MKYVLFFLFILFFVVTVSGQNQQKIDSLLYEIENTNEDSLRVNLLNSVSYQYRPYNLDKARIYIDSALNLSIKIKYPKGIANSSLNSSSVDVALGDYTNSINTLKKSLQELKKYNYPKGYVNINVWLATTYLSQYKFDLAKDCLDKAVNKAKKINFKIGLSNAYANYGNLYIIQSDYTNAIYYYTKVDSICIKHNYSGSSCSVAVMNIGSIKSTLKEYDDAMYYFNKAEKIFKGKKSAINNAMQVKLLKGIVEFRRENYTQSQNYLETALAYYTKTDRIPKKAQVLIHLGPIYRKKKQYKKAENALKEAVKLSEKLNDSTFIGDSYTELGLLYVDTKEYSKSTYYLEKAKAIFNKSFLIAPMESALKGLSESYYYNSNFKAAAKEYKEYIILLDSLNSLRNKKVTLDLETKYQTQKKEQEISLLKTKNKLVEQQKTNQRILFLSGLGLTTLIGLFFFFQYRNRKKINKKLKELDSAKSNFFTNISHEFRTPLTLILGPIQKQLKSGSLEKNEQNNLEMMQRNANRLLSLVNQLLDIAKIESGNLTVQVSKNKILAFINTLTEGFNFSAKQKQITFNTNISSADIDAWFDKNAVEKMVVNLLSNAIKYTPEKGEINCMAFVKNKQLHFEVKNTGKQLTKKELKKIFIRFYQIDENQQGTGIGLSLVKELVALYKGTISATSTTKWTIFNIILPIDKTNFKESEISTDNTNKLLIRQTLYKQTFTEDDFEKTEAQQNKEKPILLIVEDNADVRTYISTIFKNTYTILQAKNGQEGVTMALEYIPDFVISDIMMPIKNGIELCKQLKNDELTSHIPIVLLTAKAGEENEIEGIKTGADDYITKPFNEDLLQLKVNNILAIRKKIQERYKKENLFKPKNIALNLIDEQFLERVKTVLNTNLIEFSFNIEEFSKAVSMSRMQLHRKLKALTGLSASEFIRSQRLKLATQLLKESDANVSQIGYSVGFNNPGYFSKCFKEMYGKTPSEYIKTISRR